jgi:Zn-dependent protease
MDLTSGLVLGRVRGIEIRVHWSWLLIFGLLSYSLAEGFFGEAFEEWTAAQRWTASIVTSALFFVSVLVHELSHAFVAQRYGMEVPSITLFIFGGVSNLGGEMRSAGQEFRVAIAGPLASWGLAVLFGVAWLALRGTDASVVPGYLAWINAVLGVFNLLPGFPLDGGRVFRSLVWARTGDQLRATRVAARGGTILGYGLMALGLLTVLTVSLSGLWYVFIGLFLKSAADGAYAQTLVESTLRDVAAARAMSPAPAPVSARITVEQLVEDRVLAAAERAFIVEDGGRIVGLLTTTDITRLPRERWRSTAVEVVMVPTESVITIAPTSSVIDSLRLMQEHDVHQLPVLDDGRLVGLLSRGDVIRQIELRTQFARDDGAGPSEEPPTGSG